MSRRLSGVEGADRSIRSGVVSVLGGLSSARESCTGRLLGRVKGNEGRVSTGGRRALRGVNRVRKVLDDDVGRVARGVGRGVGKLRDETVGLVSGIGGNTVIDC